MSLLQEDWTCMLLLGNVFGWVLGLNGEQRGWWCVCRGAQALHDQAGKCSGQLLLLEGGSDLTHPSWEIKAAVKKTFSVVLG